jgi:HEAT repeat protein
MASLTSIAAEFRGLIATSIPHIINLLQDDEPDVGYAAVGALSKLLEYGMSLVWSSIVSLTSIAGKCQGLIATSIPQIINLLKDDDGTVRDAAVGALSQLLEHGM